MANVGHSTLTRDWMGMLMSSYAKYHNEQDLSRVWWKTIPRISRGADANAQEASSGSVTEISSWALVKANGSVLNLLSNWFSEGKTGNDSYRTEEGCQQWEGIRLAVPADKRGIKAAKDRRFENGWRCRVTSIYIFIGSRIGTAAWGTFPFKKGKRKESKRS